MNALINLSNIYYNLGDYVNALEYQNQRLDLARQFSDPRTEEQTLSVLGKIYLTQEKFELAINAYQQQLILAKTNKNYQSQGNAFNHLKLIYEQLEQWEQVELYTQQHQAIFREFLIENPGNILQQAENIGLDPLFDFAGMDLSHLDFNYADLHGANLEKTNLSYANLTLADLSGAILKEANLSYAILTNANLRDADLTGANLSEADVRTKMPRANLSHANLTHANLMSAYLPYANLTQANLSQANLNYADLTGVKFQGVNLTTASFSQAELKNVWVENVDFTEVVGISKRIKSELVQRGQFLERMKIR